MLIVNVLIVALFFILCPVPAPKFPFSLKMPNIRYLSKLQ